MHVPAVYRPISLQSMVIVITLLYWNLIHVSLSYCWKNESSVANWTKDLSVIELLDPRNLSSHCRSSEISFETSTYLLQFINFTKVCWHLFTSIHPRETQHTRNISCFPSFARNFMPLTCIYNSASVTHMPFWNNWPWWCDLLSLDS